VVIVDAPATIDAAPGPEGDDVGDGVDGDDEHAAERPSTNPRSASLQVV
jgi:hypothetical protein